MEAKNKRILFGCLGGCGLLLLLVVGSCVGFTVWLNAPGEVLEPQVLLGAVWAELYGVSILCGIGFTMSLFVGSLAFEQGGTDIAVDDRIGILIGSSLSAVFGYAWLRWRLNVRTAKGDVGR